MLFLKTSIENSKEVESIRSMERYDQMMDDAGTFVLDGTLIEPIYVDTQGFMPMFDHTIQKLFF